LVVLSGIYLFGCSETPSLSVVDVDGLTSASNVAWNAEEFAIAKGSGNKPERMNIIGGGEDREN
ncbi:MAG: hypothetical protein JW915_24730, partial [Chitinispirillaceae bacterium]|nr:hypothetical protein [Chitinispirillaceae bacterium]